MCVRISWVHLRKWWERERSKGVLVLLARADPNRRVDAVDEDLAVADLAGPRGGDDRLDRLVNDAGADRDFDLQLGKKAHRVFGAAIDLGMPLLPAVTLDLGHRQAVHPDGGERVAHLLQFERLYDRHYDFHGSSPVRDAGAALNQRCPAAVGSERERAPARPLQSACHAPP